MRKLFIFLGLLFSCVFVHSQEIVNVTLTTDYEESRPVIMSTLESNLGQVLTEINNAQSENRDLKTVSLPMDDFALKSLTMLWANVHFYCDDLEVVDRCWILDNGYMVRQIPLIITPEGEKFGSGTYQEAVVEFDSKGKIVDFYLALDGGLGESMEKCGNEVDLERKMVILKYCERFRTAYNTKDIAFLNQVFSDDALIITGNVVTSGDVTKVTYNTQDKQQYLANLRRAFARNKWIDVKFSEIGENYETGGCPGITQSAVNPNMYGVRLRQEWKSEHYSDVGYVFLMWDFTNEHKPVIHVRTWQPEWVGGKKLDESDIFSLGKFDL